MSGHIGATVRKWRARRGLTQEALAGLSGLSQSLISKIESGDRDVSNKRVQVALATALNVSVAQLLGTPDTTGADPMRDRALVHIPALRSALVQIEMDAAPSPRLDADTLFRRVGEVTELRNDADYASLMPLLPVLMLDLAGHGAEYGGAMVEVSFAARYALRSIGQHDLAYQAARVGQTAALAYGDPAWIGQAAYSLAQALPTEHAALGLRTVTAAADMLQPLPGRPEQEVYGCLHILAAHLEATLQNPASARAHLDEAADIAASLGDPQRTGPLSAGFNGNWFGPTQVAFWRVACAAELSDVATARNVASTIDLTLLPVANRHVYLHTDLARALAAAGQDDEALKQLVLAERAAPQHFRHSRVVTDLVATIVTRARRRSVAGDLERLARIHGVTAI